MSNIQLLNKTVDRSLIHFDKKGSLNYEFSNNRKDTLARIAGDIHKAALVMGISVDGEKSAITASEVLKKIIEVYPSAWVADISKAIEMGSFGQIRLPDQLNTISAANIFGWYKELRLTHPEKIGEPKNTGYQEKEMTNEEKYNLSVQGFKMFITTQKNDELAQLVFFERLVKMGLISPKPEDKNSMTKAEIEKMLENMPLDILQDNNDRRAASTFKTHYLELDEPKTVVWSEWATNPLVAEAIKRVKRSLVKEALKSQDTESILKIYKQNIADEYQVTLR
jgi:hypothetical protein